MSEGFLGGQQHSRSHRPGKEGVELVENSKQGSDMISFTVQKTLCTEIELNLGNQPRHPSITAPAVPGLP